MSTYVLEVKAKSNKCACKAGKSSKCPDDDHQIKQGELRLGSTRTCSKSGQLSTSWKHLACITPAVVENIAAAYANSAAIPGMEICGMPEAFQVAKDGGSFDDVQNAFDFEQPKTVDAPEPEPPAPAPAKKKAKKAPAAEPKKKAAAAPKKKAAAAPKKKAAEPKKKVQTGTKTKKTASKKTTPNSPAAA